MRDVNAGWLVRICHANIASFFFMSVYLHISRGLYYGSYRAPRIGVWVIGTIIFFLMMAYKWPNWMLNKNNNIYLCKIDILPFNKARTKAIYRIGPHNIDILSLLICGMLGDWWGDKLNNQFGSSVRFNIEQSISNSAYIHHLTSIMFNLGYCSNIIPKLVKKTEGLIDKRSNKLIDRYNYRLTLFTFSNLLWIYDSFYIKINGKIIKRVPIWIEEYITPFSLAHWIMQDGSLQEKGGIFIHTNSFSHNECMFLAHILNIKFKFKVTVVNAGHINQWRIYIWKESMFSLASIVKPYIINEMKYKFLGYI